jgi:hypothetical protein
MHGVLVWRFSDNNLTLWPDPRQNAGNNGDGSAAAISKQTGWIEEEDGLGVGKKTKQDAAPLSSDDLLWRRQGDSIKGDGAFWWWR